VRPRHRNNQTMFDLLACSFPTINPKLGVRLSNFIELDKAVLRQEVEGFHVANGVKTSKKGDIDL